MQMHGNTNINIVSSLLFTMEIKSCDLSNKSHDHEAYAITIYHLLEYCYNVLIETAPDS